MKQITRFGPLLIILAGIFWGSMGLFVRALQKYGFTSIQITSVRLTLSAVVFLMILRFRGPGGLRIRRSDIPLFLGLGFASVLFFTICYFTAITIMPLSTAAILLYTSPIWVMLMSVLFFREKLSGRKLLALALAFSGCVLVSGVTRRYSPYTVTAWTFLIAGIGSWFLCHPSDLFAKAAAAPSTVWLLFLFLLSTLVTSVIPYLCYTLGLKTVEASRAAILATIEPLVATLFGILIFRESPTLLSALGILLILAAIVVLNLPGRKAGL